MRAYECASALAFIHACEHMCMSITVCLCVSVHLDTATVRPCVHALRSIQDEQGSLTNARKYTS